MREKEKCRYENHSEYVVSALGKGFVCDRDAVSDGYCEFHHPSYWKENGGELRRKFYEIVEDAIENNKPLIAIGYHLPGIDLGKKIFKITFFSGAEFCEEASFFSAKFHNKTFFNRVKFHRVASFFETEFRKNTLFERVKFSNEVMFVNSVFGENFAT